jgi:hypothetical protein
MAKAASCQLCFALPNGRAEGDPRFPAPPAACDPRQQPLKGIGIGLADQRQGVSASFADVPASENPASHHRSWGRGLIRPAALTSTKLFFEMNNRRSSIWFSIYRFCIPSEAAINAFGWFYREERLQRRRWRICRGAADHVFPSAPINCKGNTRVEREYSA